MVLLDTGATLVMENLIGHEKCKMHLLVLSLLTQAYS
jgi:hypothetical protein